MPDGMILSGRRMFRKVFSSFAITTGIYGGDGAHQSAAIRLDNGRVLTYPPPFRHHDIVLEARLNPLAFVGSVQGFVTTEGRFVDRIEAYGITKAAGQLFRETETPGMLYSEDLW